MCDLAHHPVFAGLWAYWRSKHRGGLLPARRDLNPVEIPKLLPHLQLVDRTEDGEFRYRLTGTAVVDGFGADPRGKLIRDVLPPPRLEVARRHLSTVWTTGRPIWTRGRYTTSIGAEQVVTRMVLPFADGGGTVCLLLIGVIIEASHSFRARTGLDWHLQSDYEWGFLASDAAGAAVGIAA